MGSCVFSARESSLAQPPLMSTKKSTSKTVNCSNAKCARKHFGHTPNCADIIPSTNRPRTNVIYVTFNSQTRPLSENILIFTCKLKCLTVLSVINRTVAKASSKHMWGRMMKRTNRDSRAMCVEERSRVSRIYNGMSPSTWELELITRTFFFNKKIIFKIFSQLSDLRLFVPLCIISNSSHDSIPHQRPIEKLKTRLI